MYVHDNRDLEFCSLVTGAYYNYSPHTCHNELGDEARDVLPVPLGGDSVPTVVGGAVCDVRHAAGLRDVPAASYDARQ